MTGILDGFMTALWALAISLVPLWMLVRRPGDAAKSLVGFATALFGAVLALSLAAFVFTPLAARSILIGVLMIAAVWRVRGAVLDRIDGWFAGGIISVAAVSAILPDSTYINWDNYTHWSVVLKSFDFGEPFVLNSYTKFPTYPPFHTMLVYYLQGIIPFSTGNLQTYRVLLLAILSALALFATPRERNSGPAEFFIRLALFPVLVGLAFLLTGPLQSAYADFSAAVLLAIAVVAAYHHALAPRWALFTLSALCLTGAALTRMGVLPLATILAVVLVALDLGLRPAEWRQRAAAHWIAYGAAALAPAIGFGLYAAVMKGAYGTLQASPSDLVASFQSLTSGRDPALLRALVHNFLFEGKPSVAGYGLSPAVFIAGGGALGALGLWLDPARRRLVALFLTVMIGLVLAWTTAVALQMEGFFHGDATLPSFQRYLGIALFPFLVAALMPLLVPRTDRTRIVSAVVLGVAAVALQAGLLFTQFWSPPKQDMATIAIAREVRPYVGADKVWVMTGPASGDPHFLNFAYHYFLMPARTNGNNCFVGVKCASDNARTFARAIGAQGYRWVLVDRIGPREAATLAPLLLDPGAVPAASGLPALFRVIAGGSGADDIRLEPVDLTVPVLVEEDVPRQGAVK